MKKLILIFMFIVTSSIAFSAINSTYSIQSDILSSNDDIYNTKVTIKEKQAAIYTILMLKNDTYNIEVSVTNGSNIDVLLLNSSQYDIFYQDFAVIGTNSGLFEAAHLISENTTFFCQALNTTYANFTAIELIKERSPYYLIVENANFITNGAEFDGEVTCNITVNSLNLDISKVGNIPRKVKSASGFETASFISVLLIIPIAKKWKSKKEK